ncbi:hypothetical protein Q7P37_011440 [Cladosporium fusiforme]
MTIQALPQTTVRAIGASQVLTDPAAVVEELVDNALDARATSIAIEIHANTLDSIQVRDNGHGIPPPDRPLVARRYCTSKLINEHDLSAIGGSSLGFRGEALASAAEMSGAMTVTTRVEGEQVATTMKISQQGEVISQERASTAVGTTVKIADFIKSNPVRRQVALKHTDQCLKRVKHLLQAYAFSRPHVRLSLRILKAKNDKDNWMYAPKAGGNAEDAAFKVVGAACALQCTWSVVDENGFSLQAFLPRSDAAIDKISNIGSFISIDRRPVTSQRNVPKQITKMFREYLKSTDSRFDGIKEPFFLLEIGCPEQSYDPNIEPAKDDVLFEEPDKVIAAVKTLLAAVYQSQQTLQISVQEPAKAPVDEDASLLDDGDDSALIAMLEQAQANVPSQSAASHTTGPAAGRDKQDLQGLRGASPQRGPTHATFRSNMYGDDEEDHETTDARPLTGRTANNFEELRQAHKDISISNPWVMAKMNASNKTYQSRPDDSLPAYPPKRRGELVNEDRVATPMAWAPHTPRASSPPGPMQPFHPSNHVPDIRLANDGRVVEPCGSQQRSSFNTPIRPPGAAVAMMTPSSSQNRLPPVYNYGITPEVDAQQGTPLSAIPPAKTREKKPTNQRAQINRPFVSPIVNGPPKEEVWFDHLEGIEERGPQRPRRRNDASDSTGLMHRHDMGDSQRPLTPPSRNRDIREFVASVDQMGETASPDLASNELAELTSTPVNRTSGRPGAPQDENAPNNYGAISGRGCVPASELAALEARIGSIAKPVAHPPKRLKSGDRALRQISGNAPPAVEEPDDDQEYRPQTKNRRRSSAKVNRTKSSRLPLERTPAGQGTHALVTGLSITSADVATQGRAIQVEDSIIGWNEPAVEAYDAFAEEQGPEEVAAMSSKIHELLINRITDGEMVQDLGLLVQNALAAHVAKIAAEQEEATPSQEMLELS